MVQTKSIELFGLRFKSVSDFRKATGMYNNVARELVKYGTLENAVRNQRRFKYMTDAQIKEALLKADTKEYPIVPEVVELIHNGVRYMLQCEAIPKSKAYYTLMRIHESPSFIEALRELLARRPNTYNNGFSTKNRAAKRIEQEKNRKK